MDIAERSMIATIRCVADAFDVDADAVSVEFALDRDGMPSWDILVRVPPKGRQRRADRYSTLAVHATLAEAEAEMLRQATRLREGALL